MRRVLRLPAGVASVAAVRHGLDRPRPIGVVAWQDAVQDHEGGVLLLLEVDPGRREARFPAGHNEWRGRIGIRVRAPPQEGKANREVLRLVAAVLGLPDAAVSLRSGATDRRKTVLAAGVDRDHVVRTLEGLL